jgi:DNA repair protein RadC
MNEENVLADSAPAVVASYVATPSRRTMEDGVEQQGDADLLALILGARGARHRSIAASLLEDQGGVGGLARTGVGQLAQRRGVGPSKAVRILAAVELGRRAIAAAARGATQRFADGGSVVAWARPTLGHLDHEELWLLALDGQHGLRAARRVASGGMHGMSVSPRDVLRIALRETASAFILVHNHPSGDPTPSTEDIAFTSAVASAAGIVGTPLVDHVIIARERSSSLLHDGLIAAP